MISWKIYATLYVVATTIWLVSPANGWQSNAWMKWTQRVAITIYIVTGFVWAMDMIWIVAP